MTERYEQEILFAPLSVANWETNSTVGAFKFDAWSVASFSTCAVFDPTSSSLGDTRLVLGTVLYNLFKKSVV